LKPEAVRRWAALLCEKETGDAALTRVSQDQPA